MSQPQPHQIYERRNDSDYSSVSRRRHPEYSYHTYRSSAGLSLDRDGFVRHSNFDLGIMESNQEDHNITTSIPFSLPIDKSSHTLSQAYSSGVPPLSPIKKLYPKAHAITRENYVTNEHVGASNLSGRDMIKETSNNILRGKPSTSSTTINSVPNWKAQRFEMAKIRSREIRERERASTSNTATVTSCDSLKRKTVQNHYDDSFIFPCNSSSINEITNSSTSSSFASNANVGRNVKKNCVQPQKFTPENERRNQTSTKKIEYTTNNSVVNNCAVSKNEKLDTVWKTAEKTKNKKMEILVTNDYSSPIRRGILSEIDPNTPPHDSPQVKGAPSHEEKSEIVQQQHRQRLQQQPRHRHMQQTQTQTPPKSQTPQHYHRKEMTKTVIQLDSEVSTKSGDEPQIFDNRAEVRNYSCLKKDNGLMYINIASTNQKDSLEKHFQDKNASQQKRLNEGVTSTNGFDHFIKELKREVSLDHTELWRSFQIALGLNAIEDLDHLQNEDVKNVNNEKKKGLRLDSVAKSALKDVNDHMTRKYSKYRIQTSSGSQLVNDSKFNKKRAKKKKKNGKANSLSSHSSSSREINSKVSGEQYKGLKQKILPSFVQTIPTKRSESFARFASHTIDESENRFVENTEIPPSALGTNADDELFQNNNYQHEPLNCENDEVSQATKQLTRQRDISMTNIKIEEKQRGGSNSDSMNEEIKKQHVSRFLRWNQGQQPKIVTKEKESRDECSTNGQMEGHCTRTDNLSMSSIHDDASRVYSPYHKRLLLDGNLGKNNDTQKTPLLPAKNSPLGNNGQEKISLPWLASLREKQKRKKRLAKMIQSNNDVDDDTSTSIMDLGNEATNNIGSKSTVRSLFGMKVSNSSRRMHEDVTINQTEPDCANKADSPDKNVSSPWSVKLRPTNSTKTSNYNILPSCNQDIDSTSTGGTEHYINKSYDGAINQTEPDCANNAGSSDKNISSPWSVKLRPTNLTKTSNCNILPPKSNQDIDSTSAINQTEPECTINGGSTNKNVSSPWSVKLRPTPLTKTSNYNSLPPKSDQDIDSDNTGISTDHNINPSVPAGVAHDHSISAEDKNESGNDNLCNETSQTSQHISTSATNNISTAANSVSSKGSLGLSQGDIVDLGKLPKDLFDAESTVILSVSNKIDDRSKVAVLGSHIFMIASKVSMASKKKDKTADTAEILWCTSRGQIRTLTLNTGATGALISTNDRESYQLTFETPQECLSFANAFYQMETIVKEKLVVKTTESQAIETSTKCMNIEDKIINGVSKVEESLQINRDEVNVKTEGNALIEEKTSAQNICNLEVTSSPIPALTKKEERSAQKYRKMLKIAIPEETVRQKMVLEEADKKVIEAVLGMEDRTQSNKLDAEIAVPTIALSDSDEKIASKYRKMLKMGIPPDAVRHKMTTDNVEAKIANAVLDINSNKLDAEITVPTIALSDSDEKIASKYRKMLKMGIPPDAVRHKMTTDNVEAKITKAVLDINPEIKNNSRPSLKNNSSRLVGKHKKYEDHEQEEINKYRKMLKMGLPQGAVEHKMKKENVNINIVEAVLGSNPTVSDDDGIKSPVGALALNEEKEATKYRKMLKMGIPSDGVHHRMIKDKVDNKIIQAVLGFSSTAKNGSKPNAQSLTPEEEKVVLKYKKMLRLNIPKDAVQHRMTKDNVDQHIMRHVFGVECNNVTPPTNRMEDKTKKKSDLVALHWTPISKEDLGESNSIWNKERKQAIIEPKSKEISKLEEWFKKKKTQVGNLLPAKKDDCGKKLAQLVERTRAQNVSIILSQFKMFTYDELVAIIGDVDGERKIQGEKVQSLDKLLPKDDEISAIKRYKGDDCKLAPVEIFFRKLQSVKRAPSKVGVIRSMEVFQQNFEEVASKFDLLAKVCTSVMQSEKLQTVLESVLEVGNIMNAGTSTGGAAGFKFDSLHKLTQTKSMDGTITVLDYIVRVFIEKDNKHILNLSQDFPDCFDASRLSLSDLINNATSLDTSIKNCKTELIKMKTDQSEMKRIDENSKAAQSERPVLGDITKQIEDSGIVDEDPNAALMAAIRSQNVLKRTKPLAREKNSQENSTEKGIVYSPGVIRLETFTKESAIKYKEIEKKRNDTRKACKALAAYCGESGGENTATTILGILAEFVGNVDAAIIKHDEMKKRDARKEAARRSTKDKENVKITKIKDSALKNSSSKKGAINSSQPRDKKVVTDVIKQIKPSNHSGAPEVLVATEDDSRIYETQDNGEDLEIGSSCLRSCSLGSGMISRLPFACDY